MQNRYLRVARVCTLAVAIAAVTPRDWAAEPTASAHAASHLPSAIGPPVAPQSEFLMTLYLPLDQPTTIDNSLTIYNVAGTGGWVKGPHISGKIVPPGGDWA